MEEFPKVKKTRKSNPLLDIGLLTAYAVVVALISVVFVAWRPGAPIDVVLQIVLSIVACGIIGYWYYDHRGSHSRLYTLTVLTLFSVVLLGIVWGISASIDGFTMDDLLPHFFVAILALCFLIASLFYIAVDKGLYTPFAQFSAFVKEYGRVNKISTFIIANSMLLLLLVAADVVALILTFTPAAPGVVDQFLTNGNIAVLFGFGVVHFLLFIAYLAFWSANQWITAHRRIFRNNMVLQSLLILIAVSLVVHLLSVFAGVQIVSPDCFETITTCGTVIPLTWQEAIMRQGIYGVFFLGALFQSRYKTAGMYKTTLFK